MTKSKKPITVKQLAGQTNANIDPEKFSQSYNYLQNPGYSRPDMVEAFPLAIENNS